IARHLGSSLNNITYIFDEPSAGLHPEEIDKLILMLRNLKAAYNTVVVIEHHISIIKIADEIIEMGPSTGVYGGESVYQGKLAGLSSPQTGTNVHHRLKINQQTRDSKTHGTNNNANNNNYKELSVNIPKNVLVSICGVSGSGKSSRMLEALPKTYPEASRVGQGMIGISNR